jgi:DNA primase
LSIPREVIEEVRTRSSFVDIAGETVALKRSGSGFLGLCPFHTEKTPSFSVNDEEGLFYCFGCGKKGTIFDYVMEIRGYSFPEAVRFLASKCGVQIPESREARNPAAKVEMSRVKAMRHLLQMASSIYRRNLLQGTNSKAAQDYFKRRGIDAETSERFGLGYAPDAWEFISAQILQLLDSLTDRDTIKDELGFLNKERVGPLLNDLGLTKLRKKDKPDAKQTSYDVLRDRVIFPITRSDGATIGFGGRSIRADDKAPKYLNSPENAVYSKRRAFFGLHQAIPYIRASRHVFLVEGYMDVLSLYQAGLGDVLAGCGTAITGEQVAVLRRLCDRVTLLFDGDQAGRKAASACFELFINSGLELSLVLLPEGQDPDDLAQKIKGEELRVHLRSLCCSPLSLYLEQLAFSRQSSGNTEKLSDLSAVKSGKVAAELAKVLAKIENPVERDALLNEAARLLNVRVASLDSLIYAAREKIAAKPFSRSSTPTQSSPPKRSAPSRSNQSRSSVSASSNEMPYDRVPMEYAEANYDYADDDVYFSEESGPTFAPLDSLHRQLLIAVLSDPRLVSEIFQIPTMLSGSDGQGALPPNLIQFLRTLEEKQPVGVEAYTQAKEPSKEILSELQNLLNEFDLGAYDLLEQAIRQNKVGGSQPRDVIAQVGFANERKGIKNEIGRIRANEAETKDQEALAKLVQEKLVKKRDLEKLKSQ